MKIKDYFLAFMIFCAGTIILLSNNISTATQKYKETQAIAQDTKDIKKIDNNKIMLDWINEIGLSQLNENDAYRYFQWLLELNPQNYDYYAKYDEDFYEQDVCALTKRLGILRSQRGYDLDILALKNKNNYVDIIRCILNVLRESERYDVVPVIKEFLSYKISANINNENKSILLEQEDDIRIRAAGALLALEKDSNEALIIVENYIKKGNTNAMLYLFKSGWDQPWKLWNDKAFKILENALKYPEDKTKAQAAVLLAEVGDQKENAYEVAFNIFAKYANKTQQDFGLSNNRVLILPTSVEEKINLGKERDAEYACEYALGALAILRNKDAVPLLSKMREKINKWFYICDVRDLEETLSEFEGEAFKGAHEIKPGMILESEQNQFAFLDFIDNRSLLKINDATNLLKLMLKGNADDIRYYLKVRFNLGDASGSIAIGDLEYYQKDTCDLLYALISHNKEISYRFASELLKIKYEYSDIVKCSLASMWIYEKKEAVSFIKKFLDYKVPRNVFDIYNNEPFIQRQEEKVTLEAAGSLLALGNSNDSLPVLETLAKKGNSLAIPYLLSCTSLDKCNMRNKKVLPIIKNAMTFPKDSIKAEAALFLARLNLKDKEIDKQIEELALNIVKKYMNSTEKDFGLSNEKVISFGNTDEEWDKIGNSVDAARACDYAIYLLGLIKSKTAIPVLKQIEKNNMEWYYTCKNKNAKDALKNIEENGGKK